MTKQSRKKSRRSRRRRSRKRRSRKRRSRKRRSRKRRRFYMKRKRHYNPFVGNKIVNNIALDIKIIDITNYIIKKLNIKNKRQKDIFINAQKGPRGLLDPIIQNRLGKEMN